MLILPSFNYLQLPHFLPFQKQIKTNLLWLSSISPLKSIIMLKWRPSLSLPILKHNKIRGICFLIQHFREIFLFFTLFIWIKTLLSYLYPLLILFIRLNNWLVFPLSSLVRSIVHCFIRFFSNLKQVFYVILLEHLLLLYSLL